MDPNLENLDHHLISMAKDQWNRRFMGLHLRAKGPIHKVIMLQFRVAAKDQCNEHIMRVEWLL